MTVLTGDSILKFRHQVLLKGLELEIKGLNVSKGRSCYTIIKEEFNLKGNKIAVLTKFKELLNNDRECNKEQTLEAN
jgi:hypothetical protein